MIYLSKESIEMPRKKKSAEVAKKKLANQNKKKNWQKNWLRKKIAKNKNWQIRKTKKVGTKIGLLKLAKKKNCQISKKKLATKLAAFLPTSPLPYQMV